VNSTNVGFFRQYDYSTFEKIMPRREIWRLYLIDKLDKARPGISVFSYIFVDFHDDR
jgi:hypothetical protein